MKGLIMGNCRSSNAAQVAPNREATLLLLGLDNSGKTTVVANLSGESTEGTTPSIGFSSATLELNHFVAKFYDLGGSARLRNIWKNYFSEASGIIFVVDSCSQTRLPEAREALNEVLEHERMRGKPLLILANKQDCSDAIGEGPLSEQLDLNGILGEHRKLSRVVKCVALKSASGNKSDPAIKEGIKWLLGQIGRDYDQIRQRVNADVALQRALEAEKRKERAERVRKIKEERERQKALTGMATEEEAEGEGEEPDRPPHNPFKPINQAAVEIEAREKALKARNKELQQRLHAVQDAGNSESLGGSEHVGEGRRGTERDEFGGELSGARDEGEGSGGGGRGERISQSTSGLSASSDSLTDVTPEESSMASLESLHSQGEVPVSRQESAPESIQALPATAKVVSLASQKGSSHKKKGRSSLIARLKKRNRTAPLIGQPLPGGGVVSSPAVLISEATPPTHTGMLGAIPPGFLTASLSATPLVNRNMGSVPPLASLTPPTKRRGPQSGPAPSVLPGSSNKVVPSPTNSSVLKNAWTGAKLETVEAVVGDNGDKIVSSTASSNPPVLSQPSVGGPPEPIITTTITAASSTSSSCPSSDHTPSLASKKSHEEKNMEGLPELPRSRCLLPPIQITKQPGLADKAFHTEEDIAAIPKESIMQLSEPPTLASAIQPLTS